MIPIPRSIASIPILRGIFRVGLVGWLRLTRGRFWVEQRMGLRLLLDYENAVDRGIFLTGTWEQDHLDTLFGLVEQQRRRIQACRHVIAPLAQQRIDRGMAGLPLAGGRCDSRRLQRFLPGRRFTHAAGSKRAASCCRTVSGHTWPQAKAHTSSAAGRLKLAIWANPAACRLLIG